jgi:hypothetical protein
MTTTSPHPLAAAPEAARDRFETMVGRLSRQSVERHADAYADIDWDAPEMAIDPAHPGFALWEFDPLARTPWYRSLSPEAQAHVGLQRVAGMMRTGWEFENLLQRGLLRIAFRMPNFRPEFRYLHHEIIEESQHTLMFQEFVNRSGQDVEGMPRPVKAVAAGVLRLTRVNPALFFLFVLGGEEPVDHMQRRSLRNPKPGHPLVERIMRIHIAEEARHVSYARQYLRAEVPGLRRRTRLRLALQAPILFGLMTRLMVFPPRWLLRSWGVPADQVRACLGAPETRQLLADCMAGPRKLCAELGLVTPLTARLWDAMSQPAVDAPA